jgi:hypothetical protein
MDKVQKLSDSGCYTPLSVLLKIYLKLGRLGKKCHVRLVPLVTIAKCVITLRMEQVNCEYMGSRQGVVPKSGDYDWGQKLLAIKSNFVMKCPTDLECGQII